MLLTISLLFNSGCASFGPTSSPDYEQNVYTSLPDKTDEVVMMGPGYWHPNAQGFNDLRSSLLVTRLARSIPGILVVTEKDLIVLQWNESQSKYKIMNKIPLFEVRDVYLDSFGLSRRIVVQEKDYTFHSFSFSKLGGHANDSGKTESGFQLINELVKRLNLS